MVDRIRQPLLNLNLTDITTAIFEPQNDGQDQKTTAEFEPRNDRQDQTTTAKFEMMDRIRRPLLNLNPAKITTTKFEPQNDGQDQTTTAEFES